MPDISIRLHADGDRIVTLKFGDTQHPERVGEWLKDFVGAGAIGPDKPWRNMGQFAADAVADLGGEIVATDDANWVYNVYQFPNGQIGLRVFVDGNEVYYGRVKDYTPPIVDDEAREISDALWGRYNVARPSPNVRSFVVTAKDKDA